MLDIRGLNSWMTVCCNGGKMRYNIVRVPAIVRPAEILKFSFNVFLGLWRVFQAFCGRQWKQECFYTAVTFKRKHTQLQCGRRKQRKKSLSQLTQPDSRFSSTLRHTVFYYSYLLCILSSRWPRYHMTRPNPAALFVWFQQRQVRMTFMGLMRRGLISSEIQICQCRLMNFNYCRSCFSCTPTVRPARVEHPDWMQRMYRADIWCLDSDLLRAEQTLNSSGHNRESWTPSAVWNLL